MPITSALAARLAKRGIEIHKPTEEIFAEDKGIIDEFGNRLPSDWDKVRFRIVNRVSASVQYSSVGIQTGNVFITGIQVHGRYPGYHLTTQMP